MPPGRSAYTGGLHPGGGGSAYRGGGLHPGAAKPHHNRKAGGTHPTGMLSY